MKRLIFAMARRNRPFATSNFTPTRIKELESLIVFTDGLASLQVKKQKQRNDRGIQVNCIQARAQEGKQTRELCVNPDTHDLISDAWNELPDNSSKRAYSEQTEFSGHRYPRKME